MEKKKLFKDCRERGNKMKMKMNQGKSRVHDKIRQR